MSVTDMQNAPRCAARNKRTGERCKSAAVTGSRVCYKHGGAVATKRNLRNEALTKMQKFAKPLDADDPNADFITAFEVEFRRTLGRIAWYDEQIAALDMDDLHFGVTKEEDISATEFSGTNITREARVSVLVEEQRKERKHLLDMEKVWIAARLDERKLDIQRAQVLMLDKALSNIIAALGKDPNDPSVRQIVRNELLALPVAGQEQRPATLSP